MHDDNIPPVITVASNIWIQSLSPGHKRTNGFELQFWPARTL